MPLASAPPERCPACEGELRFWRTATATDPQLAGRDHYPLARCQVCGSARTELPPEGSSPDLYEGGTYGDARRGLDSLLDPLRSLIERDKLRFLSGLASGSRVLELGAGDGRFVSRLARAGFEARGIEPSDGAVAAARARGAPVQRVPVEELDLEPGSLDAVVVWHVLEHLRDPARTLARVARWLSPGGRVIVACPNLASLQARIGGDRWFHQDVPRHLTHFTASGLRLLLERSGFRLDRVSHVVVEQNPLGMWQTLLNRITVHPNVAFRALKRDLDGAPGLGRDLALTAIAGPVLVPVAIALELGAGLAGRGGSVVAVGRRDRVIQAT